MLASVLVPTRRRPAALARALAALAEQAIDEPFEVVVSVDGDDPETLSLLASLETPFPLQVLEAEATGRAGACNRALDVACGEVVAILDDDMEPVTGWLAAHCRHHLAGDAACSVGPVPVRIRPGDAPVAAYVAERFERHHRRLAAEGHEFALRDFYSGNAAMPRRLLREIGGFDERFRAYGNEDVELSLRLARRGARIVFEPEAVAYQHYGKDLAGLAEDSFDKGRTAVLLAQLHPEAEPDTRLAERGAESPQWRAAREGLLALSRVLPHTEALVVRAVQAAEHVPALRRLGLYRFVLDYVFWRGVDTARAGPEGG